MAVEASINSKKAAPLYKQNIIGKGMSALDDFSNEYNSVSASFSLVTIGVFLSGQSGRIVIPFGP